MADRTLFASFRDEMVSPLFGLVCYLAGKQRNGLPNGVTQIKRPSLELGPERTTKPVRLLDKRT